MSSLRERVRMLGLSVFRSLYRWLAVRSVDYGPGDLFIWAESHREQTTRRWPSAKEPETVDWIQTYMRPGDVVFDIGANIGNYSMIIAKHLEKRVTVFAFEPAWFNFVQLNRNVLLNGMGDCIHPVACAFSAKGGVSWLYCSSIEFGAACHSLEAPVQLREIPFVPELRQLVPVYTLDQLVQMLGQTPNHIKIDVDGIEPQIIDGASSTLHNPALRSVLVELGDTSEDQRVTQSFLEAGFSLVTTVTKDVQIQSRTIHQSNCIFVRKPAP
jgi:FkbM family methyltransferase